MKSEKEIMEKIKELWREKKLASELKLDYLKSSCEGALHYLNWVLGTHQSDEEIMQILSEVNNDSKL